MHTQYIHFLFLGVGNMVMLEPSSVQQLLSTGSEAECGSASNLHSGHKHNMWTAQMDQSKVSGFFINFV